MSENRNPRLADFEKYLSDEDLRCVVLNEVLPNGRVMSKKEFDAHTGGLHPAELCGWYCSGCCDEWEWK